MWPPTEGLDEGFVDVAAGSQGGHRESLRKLLDDGQGALADGAGGTENGESFQCLKNYFRGESGPLKPQVDKLSVP